jgi:hypothetical protein
MQMNWKKSIRVFALIGLMFPLTSQAGMGGLMGCYTRPLSDFLEAQGTTSFFFPPVQDMLAWTDAGFVTFALVDYAGLADKYIYDETGISLGTKVNGRVLECPTDDGRAAISVVINTSKALGFAQSIQAIIENNFNFLDTPTIFGVKAQDVVDDGADPALGPASFHMTFFIAAPNDPLPDIRIAFQGDDAGVVDPTYRPVTLDFRSTTIGLLADGTKARMRIQEVGATDETGVVVFTREIIDFNK